jgi:hypothetical protein
MTNQSIQHWLEQLIPISKLVQLTNAAALPFILIAWLIVVIGFHLTAGTHHDNMVHPIFRAAGLILAIACVPFFLALLQGLASGLVAAIVSVDPDLAWIPVQNPSDASLALDFTKPYAVLGQFIWLRMTQGVSAGSLLDLSKWTEYIMRGLLLLTAAAMAALTVFVMQVMLVLQKLILVSSKLIAPLFIASLGIPAAQGAAQNFLKTLIAVACWPVGWVLVHLGTMAALRNLHTPNPNATLFELFTALLPLFIVCLWMFVGTVGIPLLIGRAVTSGSNFAADMLGRAGATLGYHGANAVRSSGTAAGAVIGSAVAGPAGTAIGATVGGAMGNTLASPIGGATEATHGVGDFANRALPSSRSAAAADAVVKGLSVSRPLVATAASNGAKA